MVRHMTSADFIRHLDSRQMPRYSFGEAAQYLGLPKSTIKSWFVGTTSGSRPNLYYFKPILYPTTPSLLSFFDIASAHVLMAFHRKQVPTRNIRVIIRSLEMEYPKYRYPLLGMNFFLFGKNVILKQVQRRLNLSQSRQLGFKEVMDKFLAQLELDSSKMPIRFSPILAQTNGHRPFIVIDPNLSAGRPVIRGTGIAAEIISKRKASGESVARLMRDYRLSKRAIEEAIHYCPPQAA